MRKLIRRIFRWLRSWEEMRRCDHCQDRFTLPHLWASSGDAWFCSKCMEQYYDSHVNGQDNQQ